LGYIESLTGRSVKAMAGKKTVRPGDVSLLAREVLAVLQAAEILEGTPQSLPLYWAGTRLAKKLEKMARALEKRNGFE
jgi:hypothetical protein